MAESGFDWVLDGEDAGSTPWEFDSVTNNGSATFAHSTSNPNNEAGHYRITGDGGNTAWGVYSWTNTDKTEYWVRFYIYVPSTLTADAAYGNMPVFELYDGASYLGRFAIGIDASSEPYRWALAWGFSYSYSDTNWSTDAWHRIEVRMVTHASTGGVALYVDGDLVASDLDQDTSGDYWDTLRIGNDASREIANGDYIDFDDIVGAETQPGAYSAGGTTVTVVCSDGIAFDDSDIGNGTFYAIGSDSLGISDSNLGPATMLAAAIDAVSLGDSSIGNATIVVTAAEVVTLGDSAIGSFTVAAVASDGLALSDATTVQIQVNAQAVDGLNLDDSALVFATMLAVATDGLAVDDSAIGTEGGVATGNVTVTFSTVKGTVSMTVKRPDSTLTPKTPGSTITGKGV